MRRDQPSKGTPRIANGPREPDPAQISRVDPEQLGGQELKRLCVWLRANREGCRRRIDESGAALLRGFALADREDFAAAVAAFGLNPAAYVGGQSQRQGLGGGVYTSTAYPARETVTLHHELSYLRRPPRYLAFFCEQAPDRGGATPLLDGVDFAARLPLDLRSAFEGRGLRYQKVMPSDEPGASDLPRFGRSWQQHFETRDPARVERWLAADQAGFEWLEDGALRTWQLRPAMVAHPVSGAPVWFNQASLWHVSNLGRRGDLLLRSLGEQRLPTHARFDNGQDIPASLMQRVRTLGQAQAWRFDWQPGDLLLIDNLRVAHGREPFRGPRRVLVAMGDGGWVRPEPA